MTLARVGVIVFTAAALLTGCGGPNPTGTPSPTAAAAGLAFIDTILVPVRADQAATGVVFGIRLQNSSSHSRTITSVRPVVAISGVTVKYLGYSDCSNGCPGSEFWTPANQASLKGQVNGTVPLTVPPGPVKWTLVFLEQVSAGVFQAHPCASVNAITVRTSDDDTATVGIADGSALFGIVTNESDKQRC